MASVIISDTLLEDFDFFELSTSAQLLFFKLNLLVGALDNEIGDLVYTDRRGAKSEYSAASIAFRLHTLNVSEVSAPLNELIKAGFVLHDESSNVYTIKNAMLAKSPSKDVYKMIADRDGEYCKHCNTTQNLTIDHILPRSKGGGGNLSNLQLLCKSCNSSKSAAHPNKYTPNKKR